MLVKRKETTGFPELRDSAIELMNSMPNPIIIFNPDSSIIYINPALEELTGFSASELLWKKAPYPYWPENSVDQYLADLAMSHTGTTKFECLLRKKDGQPVWVLITTIPVTRSGKLRHILASWTDITLRRISREKMRRSEERFRILAESSHDIIYSVRLKPKFELEYISPSITAVTGYSLDEHYLNPEIALSLIFIDNRPVIPQKGEISIPGEKPRVFQWRGKDGRTLWIERDDHPIRDEQGQVIGAEGLIRDITERQQAEEALVESEAFNSSILNNAPNPIYVMEPDTTIKYVNTAFENLTGFSGKEVMGSKAPYPWWLPKQDNLNMANLHRDMKLRFCNDERCLKKKDGDVFWVQTNFKPLIINRRVKYYLNNWVDITEKKQVELALEMSEKKYRSLVNNVKLGVFRSTPDEKGHYLEVNDAMEDLTGYSRRQLLQLDVSSIYADPGDRREFIASVRASPGKFTRELMLRKKNGKKFIVACTVCAIKDNNNHILYLDGILEDITERKKAEARALEAESLKQLNKAKSELLANVSHELRTPLASIKGFVETLIQTDVNWNDEEQMDFLKSANREVDRLTSLIRDLLDMSRLDSGKIVLDKRRYSINELFDSIKNVLAEIAKKHVLTVELQAGLPSLLVDKLKIAQVVTNLVENATKFSPEGSPIVIYVKANKARLTVSVQDKGEGISPEAMSHLFNRFYQAERVVSGKTRGTGLGLAICKGIVEAHGGKIWVRSRLSQGSTFIFSIPLFKES